MSTPATEPLWRLEHRHAEGGPWGLVLSGVDPAVLRDELRAWRTPLDPGDLVRLRLHRARTASAPLWVAAPAALRPVGRVPRSIARAGQGWEGAWEEVRPGGGRMLAEVLVSGVDPRRVVLATCDCVDAAITADTRHRGRATPGAWDERDAEVRSVVEAARRWARGDAPADEAQGLVSSFPLWRRRGGSDFVARAVALAAEVVTKPEVAAEAVKVLESFGTPHVGEGTAPTHVFNLGHGITPEVDPAHAGAFFEAVHELSAQYHV